MQLGRVIGSVVSMRKVGNLKGLTLLVVDYLDENLKSKNKSVVCTDTVSAGEGDLVIMCSSSSARITETTENACTDNSIVGIVDSIYSNNSYLLQNNVVRKS
ncbi:MAG: EutN/CcmL family microcompartment protein [Ignavibacteriales bacterium]|nr:EutN/CcmL family microcompartment protein [Ignavibacteriales bacterium]